MSDEDLIDDWDEADLEIFKQWDEEEKNKRLEELEEYFKNDMEIRKGLIDRIQRQQAYIKYLEERTPIKSKIIYGDNREELQGRIDKAKQYIKVCKDNDMGIRYQTIEEILNGSDKK